MRRAIFVLEAINALLGIITNMKSLDLLGLPVSTWNIIVFSVFVLGFVALFRSDNDLEKHIFDKVIADVSKSLETMKPKEGSMDSVTLGDRHLITHSMFRDMIIQHGHIDLTGLLADRASGIPLNELMTRNCLICGQPRNQKSKEQ